MARCSIGYASIADEVKHQFEAVLDKENSPPRN
jgi:hypothetical protein